jgi:restriction system protein
VLKITYYPGSQQLYDWRRAYSFPSYTHEQRLIDQINYLSKGGSATTLGFAFTARELCSESGLLEESVANLSALSVIYPQLAADCVVSPDFLEHRIGTGFSIGKWFCSDHLRLVEGASLESVYVAVHDFEDVPEAERLLRFQLHCTSTFRPREIEGLQAALRFKDDVIGILASHSMWYADGTPNHDKALKALARKISPTFAGLGSAGVDILIKHFEIVPGAAKPTKNSGRQFESNLESIFAVLGVSCERTPVTGDFGVDLIVSLGQRRIAVQAKDHAAAVGVSAVMEGVAGAKHYQCTDAAVIARGDFTAAAHELAKTTGTKLLSEGALLQLLRDRVASLLVGQR